MSYQISYKPHLIQNTSQMPDQLRQTYPPSRKTPIPSFTPTKKEPMKVSVEASKIRLEFSTYQVNFEAMLTQTEALLLKNNIEQALKEIAKSSP